MVITFGQHQGKSAETVFLKDPSYALLVLGQQANSRPFRQLQEEIRRLISVFDKKPIIQPCANPECGNCATRFAVYKRSLRLTCWCDQCDYTEECPVPGQLVVVRTYWDMVTYASNWCSRKGDLEALVKMLAHAKGLPHRLGKHQALNFFS